MTDFGGSDELREHGTGGRVEIHAPMAILKSQEEIAIIDHNNARYAQLQKLRLGQPNTYNETSYQ